MLDVQHLEVRYGPTEVLRDVSFTVPANTVIALLGGNGSGKTTVLNAVSGLVAPRAGTVRVAGEDATGASPHSMVMRGVVQIPQGREVFADMTVQDNLEVGAAVQRDKRAIRHDLDEIYELFPGSGRGGWREPACSPAVNRPSSRLRVRSWRGRASS
jgi:branched-chain amino acid transport system ATP-binding protein